MKNSPEFKYKVADNIGVYPQNSESFVISIVEKLKFDINKVVIVRKLRKEIKRKISFPNEMTVKDILLNVIDLSSPIKY